MDPADEGHAGYLAKYEALFKKFSLVPMGWVDGPANLKFANEFSLADGYPQLIAYFRSKKQVRVFRGGFDLDQLSEFVEETKGGRKRVASLDADPVFGELKKEL